MHKILVSRCLLGENVRYDGKHSLIEHPFMQRWQQEGRIIPLCPEVAGGLPTPRLPAEIQQGDGAKVLSGETQVLNIEQADVSPAFIQGAETAATLCNKHHIRIALLKANSPSCGNESTYDGSFSNTLANNQGVTAARLTQLGVTVFNEGQLEQLALLLEQLETH